MPDEQLGFEGMPQRLFVCTPTRLTTWLDCPRRYRMTYLDRPPLGRGAPWAHNSVGAGVHNALAAWWRLPVPARTTARAGALVVSGWLTDGFRDDAQSREWQQRARTMVESYVEGLDPTDEPLGIERTVATRTDVLALSGRIDRLDLRPAPEGGEEVVVVDYKTGRHLLSTDDARGSLALAVYAVAAARVLRRPCTKVELHHLPSGEVVAWEHSPESLARHIRRAESIAREAAAADQAWRGGLSQAPATEVDAVFPPRPGSRCGWCDFAQHCPQGRAVAPRREPWAALG